ncbi:MAG TPA: hypothetical protein VMH61_07110 [Candidatus Acidoferrales bacterium]|nr:hypothetical protein [Candidatus Acidoferrales bacterium]
MVRIAPGRIASTVALVGSLALTPAAHAAWNENPVRVYGTTNSCPLIAACSDGQRGAIITWQENTSGSSGVLRAAHLLASGDLDPSWPRLAQPSTVAASRAALGAVTDGQGGAFLWWMVGSEIYLTRLAANGVVAGGWPVDGSDLGTAFIGTQRPSVVADGAQGVYLAWAQRVAHSYPWQVQLNVAHLAGNSAAAAGYPSTGVRIIGADPSRVRWVGTSSLALAPDGGLWVGWGTTDASTETLADGDYRITRLDPSGVPLAGWDTLGTAIATFPSSLLNSTAGWSVYPGMALVGVATDGGSGVYVVHGDAAPQSDGSLQMTPRLTHLDGSGAPLPGWTLDGASLPYDGADPSADAGESGSFRALADGQGNVFAGRPAYLADGEGVLDFTRFSAAGSVLSGGLEGALPGVEFAERGDGGIYLASFNPVGAPDTALPAAYVQLAQSSVGVTYSQVQDTPSVPWYGDVGLAPTGDGGAIFCWSQLNQSLGIFAVRVDGNGQVLGVPKGPDVLPQKLTLHFANGVGVQAHVAFASAGTARLQLVDVAGRAIARATYAASAGAHAWTLPGTSGLPAGLYLARVDCAGQSFRAKIAITR